MNMSVVFLLVTGLLTSVVVAGLLQTVTAVVRRRVTGRPTRR
jgi:hypothetical protein